MKNLLFLGIFLFLAGGVFAQAKMDKSAIDQATAELVSLYQLNDKQAVTMKTIQERKAKNLGEIASLEQSNPEIYKKKWLAVQEGTEASIRRLLTKEQTKIYNAKRVELL
jgi:DNA-directed RNA polymerase subunit F